MKKKASKKARASNALARVNVASTALTYRGPVVMPKAKQQDEVWTTQINVANAIASTAGGVIDTVFTPASQVQSSSDWASLAAVWNEWRILSARVELNPWNKYNLPTTTVVTPLYTVVDRSVSTAIASLATAVNFNSCVAHEPSTKVVRIAKMESPEEAEWVTTSSSPGSSSQFNIKLFSSGNTASTTYYDYFNSYMVQFRGRR